MHRRIDSDGKLLLTLVDGGTTGMRESVSRTTQRGLNENMTLSIGIEYSQGRWKTCLTENGQPIEFHEWYSGEATFTYIEQVCAFYPEPIIALSSSFGLAFCPLNKLTEHHVRQMFVADARWEGEQAMNDWQKFLIDIQAINLKSYNLPAIQLLESIPKHRKLYRGHMGDANLFCMIVVLLYRMRQREAAWSEMHFLYLELRHNSRSIVVIKDGRIIDALGETTILNQAMCEGEDEEIIKLAFWEKLTQDLAGLMALHHLEDVIIMDRRSTEHYNGLGAEIDKLGENYQFYIFPQNSAEPAGFEATIGASLLAEGLYRPGIAAEVTEHLLTTMPHL